MTSTMGLRTAARRLDIPPMTVSRWIKAGLVRPKMDKSGYRPKIYIGQKELRELENLRRLRNCGLSLQELRKAMTYLRGIGHNPLSTGRFFVLAHDGQRRKRLVKLCESGEALDLIGKRQGQLMIPAFLGEFEIRPDKTAIQHEAK